MIAMLLRCAVACILLFTITVTATSLNVLSFSSKLNTNQVQEVSVAVARNYSNPFDYAEVVVGARFTSASGQSFDIDGFWFQSFTRKMSSQGGEQLTASGEPLFLIRFSPTTVGQWTFVAYVNDSTGYSFADPSTFVVTQASAQEGFIRVADNKQYFEVDATDELFFPMGENMCWGDGKGTYDFDNWFGKLMANGGNYIRLWLDYDADFDQESMQDGLGRYNQEAGFRVDYILNNLAPINRARVMLCIETFNSLRISQPYPAWSSNPYNAANGGPIANPQDFFTNPKACALFENRLRYLVARYGYSRNLFAWEFWNEVDIIETYISTDVAAWHQTMARYISAHDVNQHMISTSFAYSPGDMVIQALPEISYTMTHTYGAQDMSQNTFDWIALKLSYGKPTYLGEYGIDDPQTAIQKDPTGIYIHNGLWSSVASLGAGTAMTWWWDNYVAPQNLYDHWAPVAAFVRDVPFHKLLWRAMLLTNAWWQAFTVVGDGNYALLWLHNRNNTWELQSEGVPLNPIGSDYVEIMDMVDGEYTLSYFDTYAGAVMHADQASCKGGVLGFKFDQFTRDVAVKIVLNSYIVK